MAGVTLTGFQTKRLAEIITGLKQQAAPIFQDLVQPGEEVDTGDTSTIGRLIGLVAPDLNELWQAAQQVYQAFDPNSAYGVALDNVVQYIGVERRRGRNTTVNGSVWGTLNTFLPEGQTVRTQAGDRFISTAPLTFTINDTIGARFTPSTTQQGLVVVLTFIVGSVIHTISHTNGAGETKANIIADLKSEFDALPSVGMTMEVEGDSFVFNLDSYFGYLSFPVIQNMDALETKKRLIFQSEVADEILAPIGSMTTILTPVFGWISVDNELTAINGSKLETDEELRERFRILKAVRAGNMADSLYSRLVELESVLSVRVYENMTNEVDIHGLPAHSFMAMVRGGRNSDIGKIIWENKPLGIASYGEVESNITDSQGRGRTVYFSRADDIRIRVSVTVKKTDSSFPDEGATYIREAIKEYINSNATFGEPLIYTRLFTPINTVPGHQVDDLKIGRDSLPLGTSNIVLDWDEYPVISDEDIAVTVVD